MINTSLAEDTSGPKPGSVLRKPGLRSAGTHPRPWAHVVSWALKETYLINYDPAGHPQTSSGPKFIGDHDA